jgi:signal transduction histidine kinase
VRLEVSVEPGAETVDGDPDRLEQALQNLAANAIRYAPAGSTIGLRAALREDGILLAVEDAGAGIPAEQLPFIFDRFYKGDASRAGAACAPGVPGGSGLGLSIVKAIAERHGGRVDVHSQPGQTVFELVLPAGGVSAQPTADRA